MKNLILAGFLLGSLLTLGACSDDDNTLPDKPEVNEPSGGNESSFELKDFKLDAETFRTMDLTPPEEAGEGYTWKWEVKDMPETIYSFFQVDGEKAEFLAGKPGTYLLTLTGVKEDKTQTCIVTIDVKDRTAAVTPTITSVLDFMPAVGQYTNSLPAYTAGDTQASMNAKVATALVGSKGMISLGGFGGYVTFGFDHTIVNVAGKRDIRVLGNAFYAAANPDPNAPKGGSCEPGIIMVAYDKNQNGKPDDDEWYEIAGSAYRTGENELWYDKALKAGNDVKTIHNYEITYYRPTTEEVTDQYIRWEDNQGNSGYKAKNGFHKQSYFPQWIEGDKLVLKGTRLPENAVDESGQGNYYVLYAFNYGYADNAPNADDESAIDIDWAVDTKGNKVHLPGVDFVKIYNAVNQESGWLGECSTEVCGAEDLHVKGVSIDTRQ